VNGIHDFEDLPVSPRALSLLARGRRIYQPMKAGRINQQVRLEPEGSPVAAGMPEAANWTVLPGTTAHQYEFRISVNLCLAANSAGTWAVLHQCGGGYGTYWIATAGPDGHSCVFESRQFRAIIYPAWCRYPPAPPRQSSRTT
jgi:hypothetical protein